MGLAPSRVLLNTLDSQAAAWVCYNLCGMGHYHSPPLPQVGMSITGAHKRVLVKNTPEFQTMILINTIIHQLK